MSKRCGSADDSAVGDVGMRRGHWYLPLLAKSQSGLRSYKPFQNIFYDRHFVALKSRCAFHEAPSNWLPGALHWGPFFESSRVTPKPLWCAVWRRGRALDAANLACSTVRLWS